MTHEVFAGRLPSRQFSIGSLWDQATYATRCKLTIDDASNVLNPPVSAGVFSLRLGADLPIAVHGDSLVGRPQQFNHWCRVVMNAATTQFVEKLNPERLDCLEIAGRAWSTVGFRSYENLFYPKFDICEQIRPTSYDLIVAEQVLEHVLDPMAAARNIFSMLRMGGAVIITTPFLIKYHPAPHDLWRWTAPALKLFLERVGFDKVESDSWGNAACVIANMSEWVMYDPAKHTLENDPEFPISVWAFGRRSD